MTKLVILESPGKISKVSNFLKEIDKENTYIVKASIGHVRELADSQNYQIGINKETVNPDFIISKDKSKVVKDLIEAAKISQEIILATDPDREGEVIAWHLFDILKKYNNNFKRMRLNAITKDCIKKEINNLDQINMEYVNAGLSRAYLDKITGYILSRVLQDNNIGLSAGRVQSAVLKILANREEEITNFVKEEWFILQDSLQVNFKNVKKISHEEEKYEVIKYNTFKEAIGVKQQLNEYYTVETILTTEFKDKSFINFTTSDYLQTVKTKLKLKVKEATKIAQNLFDKGLITYIRTDSTKLDKETEANLINYVSQKYGTDAIGVIHSRKDKETDQEGHPPITPTHFEWEPHNIQKHCEEPLSETEIKVYELIWKNTINSALKVPTGSKNTYILNNNGYLFLGETKEYIDYGYYDFDKSLVIPESQNLGWSIGQKINTFSVQAVMQNSNPKSRYNEATLIKELERLAIGRPSTYKSSVEVNVNRNYVETDNKDAMYVSLQGQKVNQFLEQNFSEFINLEFTKNMEKDLDLIAKGQFNYKTYVKNYYTKLEEKGKEFMIEQILCPKCQNGFLRQAKTKDGVDLGFKSCSNWKNCDFKDEPELDLTNAPSCEGCGTGKRFMKKYFDKKTNSMKEFESCTNYPNCKWVPGAIQKCVCGGWLVNKNKKDKTGTFIGCTNFPTCNFVQF